MTFEQPSTDGYTPTTAEVREEGVKSVNPHLSNNDDTLTFTISVNPYSERNGE